MQINGFSNSINSPGLSTNGSLSRERGVLVEPSVSTGPVTTTDSTVQSDSGRRVAASTAAPSTQSRQQQEVELTVLRELAARDREVRQHEMAHQMAGGQYSGGATYTFERGPDGVMYAVGGQVSIDTSPVAGDPEATLQKAQTIERAAMAPADPSPQDLRVAASARAMAAEARIELLREQQAALQGVNGALDGLPEDQTTRELTSADDVAISAISAQQESAAAVTADEAAERLVEEESAGSRRASVVDEFEAQRARREEIAEAQQERRERSAESLREFARDLAEIQTKLAELNKRLFETGALHNFNAPGKLLDRQI